MSKLSWNLCSDLGQFELSNSHAHSAEWNDEQALYLDCETGIGTSVLWSNEVSFESFRLEVEIATDSFAFVGLVFGATDSSNYELVYVSPGSDSSFGEIQYDPIMNGSSTWQIYQGPKYQAPAPFFPGKWTKLSLVVNSNTVAIYVGDTEIPQLVIPNLQTGRSKGKAGVWGYLPCYLRNFSVEQIDPPIFPSSSTDLKQLAAEAFITEWEISQPYIEANQSVSEDKWIRATVEENGTLNLNRLFTITKGTAVQARCKFTLDEAEETLLTWGFSDQLKLWVNDIEIYQGEWKWDPPNSDGRIRADFASASVRWQDGLNTIRAEVTSNEAAFGWGLSVKTGLSDLLF